MTIMTQGGPAVGPVAPRELRDHVLAHGGQVVDLAEVAELTGLPPKAAAAAMARLRASELFFSPAPGLYVAIPPQYATWGAVPGADFIDPMMAKLGRRYYVALLSAAQLHGAAHQRPQVFQVMVDGRVADRDFRRVRLRFYYRRRVNDIPTVLRNSATGQMRVATPAATAFDLASRPHDAGGLDNVATVLGELVAEGRLEAPALQLLVTVHPAAVTRRLGWLLDRVGSSVDTAALTSTLEETLAGMLSGSPSRGRATSLLDPSGERRGTADRRWGLVVNTTVEPDL